MFNQYLDPDHPRKWELDQWRRADQVNRKALDMQDLACQDVINDDVGRIFPTLRDLPEYPYLRSRLGTGLRTLLIGGHTIERYIFVDNHPSCVRWLIDKHLPELSRLYPDQFPQEAWEHRHLAADLLTIDLDWFFSQEPDIIIASPPCQPWSLASGLPRGYWDPRADIMRACVFIIQFCAFQAANRPVNSGRRKLRENVGWIVENIPASAADPRTISMLGLPVVMDAKDCGSFALRRTAFWTNLASPLNLAMLMEETLPVNNIWKNPKAPFQQRYLITPQNRLNGRMMGDLFRTLRLEDCDSLL
eukprot:scaffold569649_cov15-Prasinocladus_malaysianus.AAC.1